MIRTIIDSTESGNQWCFAVRATASDTLALATEMAIINMYDATWWVVLLCLQEGVDDLLFDQPRTVIAGAAMSR